MSDELTLRVSLSFSKGGTVKSLSINPTTFDVSGDASMHHEQVIGFASEEAVILGDVSPGGFFIGINRDPTNFIELRADTGLADLIKLKPGEPCMFRLTGDATLYAQADTGNCKLEYVVIDD